MYLLHILMNSKIDKDEHSLSDFLAGNRTHEHHGVDMSSFMYEDECIRYVMKVEFISQTKLSSTPAGKVTS